MSAAHPGPWRWVDQGGDRTSLRDANNEVVLDAQGETIYACHAVVALTELAPEMETLLRNKYRQVHGPHCDGFGHHACAREWDRQREALLARVDAARANTDQEHHGWMA